jgi:hypothetical protein
MKKVLVITLAAVLLTCSLAGAAVDPFRGILASFILVAKMVTNPDWAVEAVTTEYDPVEDAYHTADKLLAAASIASQVAGNVLAGAFPTEEGYTGGGGGPNAACQ